MLLSRRHLFLGSVALGAAAAKRPAEAPPNVLLVLADDLAAWMLGCYGNKEIRTPNIDRMARTGTRFTNSYTCTPAGSASRATMLTGRTPMQHGIQDTLGPAVPPPSFQNEIMLSDLLAGAGYQCGYVGRWHMGNDEKPQHHFNHWYTLAGEAPRYQDPVMNSNGKGVEEKGYLGDLLTASACQFLDQQQAGKPFFLTVSYFNPHMPYEGHPRKYYDLYAKTAFETTGWLPAAPNAAADREMLKDPVGNTRKCAAAVTALDDQVPILESKLSARGFANTLVVFTSDSGFLLGRHGLWSGPLASDPPNLFEEVIQVPMIWNWLGKVAPDNVRPELISLYDLLPTVCEATGAVAPAGRNLCGRSYLSLATNKPLPKKEPWLDLRFSRFRDTAMARDGRYKAVVRGGGTGAGELYDLREDPGERVNQYDNPRFVNTRDRLVAALDAWRKKYSA